MRTVNSIAQPINRLLPVETIKAVLETLVINKPVKILKFIARTGKYLQGTCWIYVENEITGDRRATFVSFADLLRSFWIWLETAQVMLMALYQRIAVSRVVWQYVEEGDRVYSPKHGWVTIIEKELVENFRCKDLIPRFWIETEEAIDRVMACEVELF